MNQDNSHQGYYQQPQTPVTGYYQQPNPYPQQPIPVEQQNTQVQAPPTQEDVITSLVLAGDLSMMTNEQKVLYYNDFCKTLKLNPLTQPFEIIKMKGGKLKMYAKKDATDQLRRINGVSITDVQVTQIGATYIVKAIGHDREGRTDIATAAIDLTGKTGEDLANALMKCETKAKRRLTLSLCGLGILDETEVEDMNNVVKAPTPTVDIPHSEEENQDLPNQYEERYEELMTFLDNWKLPQKVMNESMVCAVLQKTIKDERAAGKLTLERIEKCLDTLKKEKATFIKQQEDEDI